MITRNNYEIYFLDYYDGSLPAEQVAELFLFLESHPDLKEEFDAFENIKLTDDLSDEFPAKASLKKTEVIESNLQQFLIAELEGDLNTTEQKELNDYVATHPALQHERTLYAKTKAVADLSIKYPNKGELKKTIAMFGNRNLILSLSIAASLLLLMGIYFISNQDVNPKQNNAVAVVDDKTNGNGTDTLEKKKSAVTNNVKPNEVVKTPAQKSFADSKNKKNTNQERHVANNSKQNKNQEVQIQENNVAQQNQQPKPEPENNQQQKLIPEVKNPIAQNNVVNTSESNIGSMPKTTIINTMPSVSSNQPNGVKDAVTNFANEKLASFTGSDDYMDSGKRKNKKLDVLTWAVNKVGGKKVKMVTQYDAEEKVAAVDVAAKGFSIEHIKGF